VHARLAAGFAEGVELAAEFDGGVVEVAVVVVV
jgi:hypothetical protein